MGVGQALIPSLVFSKKEEKLDTQSREGHVPRGAESRGVRPQAKDSRGCWTSAEARSEAQSKFSL